MAVFIRFAQFLILKDLMNLYVNLCMVLEGVTWISHVSFISFILSHLCILYLCVSAARSVSLWVALSRQEAEPVPKETVMWCTTGNTWENAQENGTATLKSSTWKSLFNLLLRSKYSIQNWWQSLFHNAIRALSDITLYICIQLAYICFCGYNSIESQLQRMCV